MTSDGLLDETVCVGCKGTVTEGAVACPKCLGKVFESGITWGSVDGDKDRMRALVLQLGEKERRDAEDNAKNQAEASEARAREARQAERIGQLALADHAEASLLLLRMPGVSEVGRFVQGHGRAAVTFVVLEGPGLPAVGPGDLPWRAYGLEDVFGVTGESADNANGVPPSGAPEYVQNAIRKALK